MLDLILCFHRGGLVLWRHELEPVAGAPVSALIRDVLLEERSTTAVFHHDKFSLKWCFDNELDLVFVAVYQRVLQLNYVDELLIEVRRNFVAAHFPSRQRLPPAELPDCSGFTPVFQRLYLAASQGWKPSSLPMGGSSSSLQQQSSSSSLVSSPASPATSSSGRVMRSFADTKRGQSASNNKPKKPKRSNDATKPVSPALPDGGDTSSTEHEAEQASGAESQPVSSADSSTAADDAESSTTSGLSEEERLANLERLKAQKGGKPRAFKPPPKKASTADLKPGSKPKRQTTWEDKGATGTEARSLDFTGGAERSADDGLTDAEKERLRAGRPLNIADDGDLPPLPSDAAAASRWGFGSMLNNLTNRTLTAADLAAPMDQFRNHLVNKNVASDIADRLCQSVQSSLVGTTHSAFSSISTLVRTALEEALTRILTPKRNVDILRDIKAAQAEGRPYSIVFVGVNGVGKSTNLSKVCYWLKSQNFKVMIAACDTFRAGAVEQLRVHSERLDVPLFQKGYGKDAANIARDALREAASDGVDVVLIDTAGRMQDNLPLMQALSKLVTLNNPDLILFVGEALVGNEAVDQLTKFNRALADLSDAATPRQIDGIVLSKWDTVDDRVGAALSMVYTTGQPVVFVGTGQHYECLRTFSVSRVVHMLLK